MSRPFALNGRLGLVLLVGAAVLAVLWLAFRYFQQAPDAQARNRPNIVLFIADDMTWTDSSAYGSQNIRTPNIDRLAAEGLKFNRAFQATAMCAVTRQQLFTGLDPVRSGAYPQHSVTNPGVNSVFLHMRAMGYRVGLSGKTHIGPRENFPYQYLGDDKGKKLPPIDFKAIRSFIQRDDSQPFFLVVASHRPHEPWTQGDPSEFDAATLRLPPYLVDTPETRQKLTRYYAAVRVLDNQVGAMTRMLAATGKAKNTLFIFTSEQGSTIPFAKWTLYDAGIRTELIARWPGKVKPHTTTDAIVTYADVMPTILAAAGGKPPPNLDGESFLNVLRGRTDRHHDKVFGIHTNVGIIGGQPYPIRSVRDERYKLIRNLTPDREYTNLLTVPVGPPSFIQDWELAAKAGNAHAAERVAAYRRRPAVELYDLKADPYELRNLAGDPKLATVQARMQRDLEDWMHRQGDTGLPVELAALRHVDPAVLRGAVDSVKQDGAAATSAGRAATGPSTKAAR